MNTPQVQIPTDTWISATWDEYLQVVDHQAYAKAKGYYYDHKMRIELAPLGQDHAADNTIASFTVNLFCGLKAIPTQGLTNCTFRQGLRMLNPIVHITSETMLTRFLGGLPLST